MDTENDPVVFQLIAVDRNFQTTTRDIRRSELRNAPVGTVFSVGDEEDGERATVTACSGKEPGGVAVVVETRSRAMQRQSFRAGWLSDAEPAESIVFSDEPDADLFQNDAPEGTAEWPNSPQAAELTEYDRLQERKDLLLEVSSPEGTEALLDYVEKEYDRRWKQRSDGPEEIWFSHEKGFSTAPDPLWPTVAVAELPPVDRTGDGLDSHGVSAKEVLMDAMTGAETTEELAGLRLASRDADFLAKELRTAFRRGDILVDETNCRSFLKDMEPKIERSVSGWRPRFPMSRPWLQEKTVAPKMAAVQKELEQIAYRQAEIDKRLEIGDVPKMKRMAYAMRIEAFTRNVDKDIKRYIRPVEPYDLQKGKTDAYIVPKTFWKKIETAALRVAPDWKKKVYRTATVQEEIGDETKYRVSIPCGKEPVMTLLGSEKAYQELRKDLRRGYLRDVCLDAERLDPKYDVARAEKYVSVCRQIQEKETICHELSDPKVLGGEDARKYFQQDLAKLRLSRDQIAEDLMKTPGMQPVFDKFRKRVSALGLSGKKEADRINMRISFNRFAEKATAPEKLLTELSTKYGLKTADHIRGFTLNGKTCSWDVPQGSTPLRELGISERELASRACQGKAELIVSDMQQAIEHPEPLKEKKWTRSRGRGFER